MTDIYWKIKSLPNKNKISSRLSFSLNCPELLLISQKGAKVEIIGVQQSLEELATQMDTIPYEVMTGISKRVHRIYIEE